MKTTPKRYRSWDELPMMLVPEDIAALFGVTVCTAKNWISGGKLPSAKIGGKVFVEKDAIKSLFANGRKEAVA